MKRLAVLLFILTLVLGSIHAQTDTSAIHLTISAYAEPYYGYDFNKPADGNRPGFVYAHNRHNEFNVNLAYLKAAVSADWVRGNLAIMAGTYPNANLSAEPGSLKNILEANAGIKILKNRELWLDAGIFPSHIGFESAVGKDCWTLTRSMMAENSPYYEAGYKISYTTLNEKWFVSGLILNGWQSIHRAHSNLPLATGVQIQYKPNDKITLNCSTYMGTEQPDSVKLARNFGDFYGIFQFNDHFGLTLGFDVGGQEMPQLDEYSIWYSPVLIARYTVNDQTAIAGRLEYYSDKDGVLIQTNSLNGFQTMGVSLNLDAQIHKNAIWRVEGKLLSSKDKIFTKDNLPSKSNAVVTTSIAVWF